uniref:Uncharacterized protein n=1 Tax=Fagus sylvatica TaxID=28930 RepID=A0A2N9EUC0_FAGSY
MAGKEHVVSTEKSHLGISVVREAGERSSCVTKKAQTDGTIPIIPTTREARLEIVREAKESVMNQSRTPTPKIQKVIFFLRDHKDFQKYYKPRVVSVGPIHHGNKKYQLGDDYKRLLTSEFVNCSGKTREHLYEKIEEKIKELRDCFDEEVTKDYDDEALAGLLFLDGCAILQEQHWQSCRNLQDLKAAGICLKRSSDSCLRNISFSRGFHRLGHLYLPPIHVDYSMRTKLLNLIAYEMCLGFENDFEITFYIASSSYEMCPDFESDLGVTSYICFLHSLIDEAKDVKELRQAGIFYEFLGSDEEVAQLFNEIGTDLVYNTETYKSVQKEIQNHYDRRINFLHCGIRARYNSPTDLVSRTSKKAELAPHEIGGQSIDLRWLVLESVTINGRSENWNTWIVFWTVLPACGDALRLEINFGLDCSTDLGMGY